VARWAPLTVIIYAMCGEIEKLWDIFRAHIELATCDKDCKYHRTQAHLQPRKTNHEVLNGAQRAIDVTWGCFP